MAAIAASTNLLTVSKGEYMTDLADYRGRVTAILAVVAERVSHEIGATDTARIWPLIEATTKALAQSAFQEGRDVAGTCPQMSHVASRINPVDRGSEQ
ncbi:hypothetical protein [Nocardia brasiliensis]|uniref:hypothetical protein n=1 Tax=Nocardia brasiliensis TaxID=37326 RepID=UPI00114D291B|nr:hypothetical protein [Nocardia brasiliensis]